LFIELTRYELTLKIDFEKAQGEEEEADVQALYQGLEDRIQAEGKEKKESHSAVEILVGLPSEHT